MRVYAMVLVLALAVTYLLTPLARMFAVRVGALAHPRTRDVHLVPTPRLGGLAILAGVLFASLLASRISHLAPLFGGWSPVTATLAATSILCLTGALDDRFDLAPLTKLAAQALAGTVLSTEVRVLFLPKPGPGTFFLPPVLGMLLTVLVVVVVVNALNFVDGIDGLATAVAVVAAASFFIYSYTLTAVQGVSRLTPATLTSVLLLGGCLGFLPRNLPPAKVFMGDAGSSVIGVLLAACAVGVTGQVDPSTVYARSLIPAALPVVLPLLVLAVPLFDLVSAVVRRARRRVSVLRPDRDHLHHRMLRRGLSPRLAVGVLTSWSAALAVPSVVAALFPSFVVLATLGGLGVFGATLAVVGLRPAQR